MGLFLEGATPDFQSGQFLGALLLVAGLCVGFWLGRRSVHPEDAQSPGTTRAGKPMRGFLRWIGGFAGKLSTYRQEVDRVGSRAPGAGQPEPEDHPSSSILPLLSQMVHANEDVTTRLTKAEAALQEQAQEIAGYVSEARTDILTGLPNRRVFDDELGRHLAEWRKSGCPVSVLMLDIDHFKNFNDQHGHLAGDVVLAEVARRLRDSMNDSGLVARLGGEEFAVILPECKANDAARVAETARRAIERAPFEYEQKRLQVTVSCGAAQVRTHENASALIKRADEALYASKAGGRNCTHLHCGSNCIPVTNRPPAHSSTAKASRPTLKHNEEFRQVCQDLRQRLLTVVEQEA